MNSKEEQETYIKFKQMGFVDTVIYLIAKIIKRLLTITLSSFVVFVLTSLLIAPFLWLFGVHHIRDNAIFIGFICAIIIAICDILQYIILFKKHFSKIRAINDGKL